MMQVRHSFTARRAVNGIWSADKPLHSRLNGSMTARTVVETLPDCTKCGGLTEAWRIAWTAHENHVQWVPHGWNTAVGLAADIHLSCAMPVARYVEFLTPSPYMDELVTKPFRPDAEGFLNLPEGPGLGIELNREALERFRAR